MSRNSGYGNEDHPILNDKYRAAIKAASQQCWRAITNLAETIGGIGIVTATIRAIEQTNQIAFEIVRMTRIKQLPQHVIENPNGADIVKH